MSPDGRRAAREGTVMLRMERAFSRGISETSSSSFSDEGGASFFIGTGVSSSRAGAGFGGGLGNEPPCGGRMS